MARNGWEADRGDEFLDGAYPNPLLVPEILALIFSRLGALDLARVAVVCRTWRDCAADEACLCAVVTVVQTP